MSKVSLYDTIISPVITEKSSNMSTQNKVVFKVAIKSNKKQIKKSVEEIFKVKVKSDSYEEINSKHFKFFDSSNKAKEISKEIKSILLNVKRGKSKWG